jgi:UDP-N-acetylmuramyl pentapeptide phosphotransferase/UDP-N-acetylglucosamine-1-phosphate transferase
VNSAPWICLATSAGALAAAWLVHTRIRGFLFEDSPAPGRKRHARPTPMAGVVPGLVSVAALAASGLPWFAGAVAFAGLVGWMDDRAKDRRGGGLNWTWKGLGLLAAASLGALDLDLPAQPTSWVTAVGFVFVVTNALNFLDNQDGVATSLGSVALLAIGGGDPGHPATVLGAGWLAFLPFNWPDARMFLGDAGAYALGIASGLLALAAAEGAQGIGWTAAVAPLLVPLLDFGQVTVARIALGYAPWIGDRRHLTHLLLHAGTPRVALAPLLALVNTAGWWLLTRA